MAVSVEKEEDIGMWLPMNIKVNIESKKGIEGAFHKRVALFILYMVFIYVLLFSILNWGFKLLSINYI